MSTGTQLQVEVREGAHTLVRRTMARYDNVLVGPSPEAEVHTDRVPRMIPLIRSSPGGKGWELVYPPKLDGHVTAAGRMRSLEECAKDPSARRDGDLAVFPLPAGAVGAIELGPLFLGFREIPDSAAGAPVRAPDTDETGPTAVGIAVIACLLGILALLAGPRDKVGTPDEFSIWSIIAAKPTATPEGHGTRTGHGTPRGRGTAVAIGDETPGATDVAIDATPAPGETGAAIGETPSPGETPTAVAIGTTGASGGTPTPAAMGTGGASGTPTPMAAGSATGGTPTPLALGTGSAKGTPTPIAVGTGSAKGTPTPVAVGTRGASGTPTPMAVGSAKGTPTPVAVGSGSAKGTPTPVAVGTGARGTPTPVAVGTGSAKGTPTPIAIGTGSAKGTPTPAAVGTSSAKGTPTPVAMGTGSAKGTPTPVAVGTESAKGTPTPVAVGTGSAKGTPTPVAIGTGSAKGTPTPRGAGGTPTPLAMASPVPTDTRGGDPAGTPRPRATPGDRDPMALAVASPHKTKAAPTPTPPPSGFLGQPDQLEDDAAFTARLDAVPTIKYANPSGSTGPLPSTMGAGSSNAGAHLVRDGGFGQVGPVDVSAAAGDVKVASAGKMEQTIEARMTAEEPRVTGTISADRVRAIVEDASGALRACYEQVLRRNPRIAGRVVLRWTIVEDGAVEEISVVTSALKSDEVEQCLMTRVRRLRFPRPEGGTVTVEFPLVFQPAVDPS